MDLRHLRYFICVAEEMHFGRAARRLGISQPPLSQQIRALEEELGVRLFERTSRRVCLTEAGKLFAPEAQQTLLQADRAMQTARRAHRGEVGHLGLGFTTSGPYIPVVASALYRFREAYPKVELTLQELGRDEQIARIQQGQLDMGLIRGTERPCLPPEMEAHCLLTEELVLAMRVDHPLALQKALPRFADLAEVPLVLYGAASGAGVNEYIFAQCEREGFRPAVVQEAGSFAMLLGLVAAGFGATIIAQSLARLNVESVVHRHMESPITSRLWMVHNKDISPTASAFRASIIDHEGEPPVEQGNALQGKDHG